MNVQNMTAKIFRDITRRKFSIQDVCDILILLTAMYFLQLARGRQAVQFEGVDKFAEEVKTQLRLLNLETGAPN
ncbi:hypothetical protein EVB39_014 [Rhizobium phage RHph_TM3_3_9]|nr:hypothetical protein EVB39_014 [Rhizobium phage RHph_TM3_3_9]QIG67816.1 hypothetical protein EVB53_014 [Rhizobium phage RHph_Y60]QIG68535.1 hypothetical protein EVB66_014 [Rhizobium phage RHph_TM3_3_13]QIG73321.1 hypothetical protein EVC03_013 [Rhizobium phage RHph_Y5A]QIG74393.1 hypothetical protein EVC09_013 [Rhizobium phage RHph_TM3_3_10]QIG75243.1 hypothetical protein EVC16_014 [Rhizobium phage RHph_Y21]QIG75455.1 hypothetical protein EVC18_013 [Rhizobium phage RHph_Y2_4]QIG76715.1 hy